MIGHQHNPFETTFGNPEPMFVDPSKRASIVDTNLSISSLSVERDWRMPLYLH